MAYQVDLLPRAVADLDEILAWLKKRSPSGASKWLDAWLRCISHLEKFADKCQIAPESERHAVIIRQIVFRTRSGNPYRALFIIRENLVQVMHIRGFGRDLVSDNDLELPK